MTPPTPFFAPRRAPSRFRYVPRRGGVPSTPKTAALTEDFTAFDGAKWQTFGSPVVTSGQLQLTIPASPIPQVYETVLLYDLTGSSMTAEFVQAPNSSALNSVAVFGFSPQHDTQQGGSPGQQTEWVYFFWYQSQLWFSLRTALVDDLVGIAYDSAAHRFLRLRETSGTIAWDTSPDGNTWTNRRTLASTWNLSSGYVGLEAYTFANDVGAGTAIFDNVNITPAVPGLLPTPPRRVSRPPQARRRGRVEVTPPQIVVAAPSYRSDPRRVARRFVQLPRRDRSVEIVPPQATPPPETSRRRVRGFVARRRGRVEVVPTQIVAAPPAYAPDTRRRVTRGFASRRRRSVEVVPPQIVVTPPATPTPETRRAARRLVGSRRGRFVTVTPPQERPLDPQRRSPRGFVARRRNRRVEVVPPQIVVAPPAYAPDTRRRVTRGFASRRRRSVEVTPPQIVVAAPRFVPTPPPKRGLRSVPRPRRRAEVVPPQAAAPAAPRFVSAPARRALRSLVRRVGHAVGLIAPTPTGTLGPGDVQVTLTAEIYDRTLTAQIYTRTLTATDIY